MKHATSTHGSWIEDAASMAPFFMAIVSGGDRWMYVASTGGLTAGRRDPDGALFPYETDDRLCAADGTVGPRTIAWIERSGGKAARWEPFLRAADGMQRTHRRIWKSDLGDEVLFEERNDDLAATFRYSWRSGARFGFVREAELRNDGASPMRVRMLDGLLGVMPACVDRGMQAGFSNLVDAYKLTERGPCAGLAVYRLSSIPSDRAKPNEALLANCAWVRGLPGAGLLLSARQLRAFRLGQPVVAEDSVRGSAGALLAHASFELAPGASMRWTMGVDGRFDAAQVIALADALGEGEAMSDALATAIAADRDADRQRLLRHLAAVDGLQATGDSRADARHLANALFNTMRGGVFLDDGRVRIADFARFLRETAPVVALRCDVSGWADMSSRRDLVARAEASGDADLERLAREYLPLTWSRRHGDPSRPWNLFALDTHDADGSPRLRYEGNWRDIFQNWEALLHAFPAYAEAAVVKFVNASTRDGFNPYRVSREGFDWERPDPSDPWAHIGYWGDHQIVYLQRLIDVCERHEPRALSQLLRRRLFVFADVPYRIANHDQILADPHETITFDVARDAAIRAAAKELGNEARLAPAVEGARHSPLRVSLAEKLLVPILAKLGQFIPGLGIWMNTQRPEWNDANNALVGRGVSVVTAAHLLRHCRVVLQLIQGAGAAALPLSSASADWLGRTLAALEPEVGSIAPPAMADQLGRLAASYRERVYRNASADNASVDVAMDAVARLLERAHVWLLATVRDNLREDGLLHSYNLVELEGCASMQSRRLDLMLEGQAAGLASGALSARECAQLLDALRKSPLRREDLGAYLLYPDRSLPSFLDKGLVPAAAVAASPLVRRLLAEQRTQLLRRDANGAVRFAPSLRNEDELAAACNAASLSAVDSAELARLYESVFDHAAFTGRSGSFFGYEGLGCIYWHMMSKLRLAVLEAWIRACDEGAESEVIARLAQHYDDVTAGLGAGLAPKVYGAFPSDPYSHTPSHAGVRQPGMTGQVKEDLVARRLELGLHVEDGRLTFRSPMPRMGKPLESAWRGAIGARHDIEVPAGAVAFSVCGVPVVMRTGASARIVLKMADGSSEMVAARSLSQDASRKLFDRSGAIERIEVEGPFA